MGMEVSLGDYCRMMFEVYVGDRLQIAEHWKSVEEEARPLVEKLLALHEKLGYVVVGMKKDGKKVRRSWEIARDAKIKLWGVKAKTLKIGNEAILLDDDRSCEESTVLVVDKSKKAVYVEIKGCGERYTGDVDLDNIVLKCPDDFDDNVEYEKESYWLAKAEELGIT